LRHRVFRALIWAAIAAVLLLAAPAAIAAPICFNQEAQTVRCDAKDAMPVGWRPSAEQIQAQQATQPPEPSASVILQVVLAICAFLAMIALLPEFDGSHGADWDREEDDERR
jgi:hypothetical protein